MTIPILYQITTANACFGVEVRAGVITAAAPIAGRVRGKAWSAVATQYQGRGVSVAAVSLAAPWAFEGGPYPIARAYWQEEVRLGCKESLARLERICTAAGWSYGATVEGIKR